MKLLSLGIKKKEKEVKKYIVDNKESLYRFAYTYVRNEDDALDIVHDAICKSLTNVDTLKDIDSIKPWIYKIVANTAIDYIRKNSKYVIGSDDLNLEESAEYDTYEDIDLQRALEVLPEKYKDVIVLRYFEDMKISDIAKILDEKESTIKTRLYKALSKLKISITE
ncbi:RNA polymerase sigma factor [Romboutsia sp. 1001713B170207_170306_H8]|uniref:RNA polymerase sigma factor n=1 Tax=Romboutsia sp. 1001713B170207_170306_H8 TaxID=2787112 RepID=UPI00082123BD|nr:sigma-70 family RNA polymerase sigma factor [Romboutsia sp. 1001713B170207_170306_H8]SCH87960.1 RNA polymerase sigma factor sigV [uncultured Clostridium sp.]